jgi:hypothetical protein
VIKPIDAASFSPLQICLQSYGFKQLFREKNITTQIEYFWNMPTKKRNFFLEENQSSTNRS